jgi:peptidoglycan/xylan/chitin deacetylase (PgdA/CDA1 family)
VLRALGRRAGRLPVVLTYHAIGVADIQSFNRQMKELARRAVAVFADFPLKPVPQLSVAVTFDDGFQNVFDHALPILAKHGIPATVFIPTGCLGIEPEWMPENSGRRAAVGRVVSARTLEVVNFERVKLGSHTVTHPRLAELAIANVEVELAMSRRKLEDITSVPIKMLSLPYGSFTTDVIAAALRVGYGRVFANVPVRSRVMIRSPLVGRIDVSPRDWPLEFRLKSSGAYDWLAVAIPAKRAAFSAFGRRNKP